MSDTLPAATIAQTKKEPGFIQQHRIAVLIILVGILIRLPLVFIPPNSMGYPWRVSDTDSIARNFSENGYHVLYPQIYWGGAGPGYVETEFQLYPFIVSLLYGVFGEHYQIARLVSLSFSILAFILLYALARRNIGAKAALWALAFFVIAPMYIRFSIEIMPEATVMCFYLGALYFFQRWLEGQKRSDFMVAAASTALAILVKPTSIHIGFVFLLLLLQQYRLRAFTRPAVWLFGVISLVPGILWYWHAHNLYITYGNTFGILSGGDSKFGNVLSYWLSLRFYLNTAQIDVTWVLTSGGTLLFILGAALCLIKRQTFLLLIGFVSVWVYYLLVPRYISSADMGLQYHIYFVPYAALSIGVALSWLSDQIKGSASSTVLSRAIPALAGLVLIGWCVYASGRDYRDFFTLNGQVPVACGLQVKSLIPTSARIISSSDSLAVDHGVDNNYQDPIIFYYSRHFGWSLAADQHTPDKIQQFRQQGASYFVIYSMKLYNDNPALVSYLNANAQQVGPGIDAQCGIYKFNPSAP